MIVARQGLKAHEAYAEYRSYSEMLTYVDARNGARVGNSDSGGGAAAVSNTKGLHTTVGLPGSPLTPATGDV